MATIVRLRPLPHDIWNMQDVEIWRANEARLHAFMRAKGAGFVTYPNGNAGWEGPNLRKILQEYAEENKLQLEWSGGTPHVCSSATLTLP